MEPKEIVEYAVFVGWVAGTLFAARWVADSKRYAVTRVTARAGKSAGKAAVRASARRRR